MACEAVQMWSLRSLIAAFLDLAITYLLLCVSVVAYVSSKFLGFFGLNLPCPCNYGVFLNINNESLCLGRLLIDFPSEKISNLQLFVRQKFPFSDYYYHHPNRDGHSVLEDEASCSSVSEVVRRDFKGKGVVSHRPRSRLVRRRKGKNSCENVETKKGGNGLVSDDNGGEDHHHHLECDRKRQSVVTSYAPDEDTGVKQNILSIEEVQDNDSGFQDDKNRIRLLEEALEEERIARAALYIELEKERSAAASAADEAMAMILRLQEEKAAIEMEDRQYQRILEGKSAYDAEEMTILKEILVRREMEKYFLEKEIESYRQMTEQLIGADSDERSVNVDLQEKEIISFECERTLLFDAEEIQDKNLGHKPEEKIIVTCNGTETDNDQYKDARDIHIIGDDKRRTPGLPPVSRPSSSMRRNSTSVMDAEMLKIDTEVRRLRERLRLVQEGRDKLRFFSAENREKENVQLKLLEDIARQVQEIRDLTGRGRAARQASLPLPNSKVTSKKKRRSRSVSSFHVSSEG